MLVSLQFSNAPIVHGALGRSVAADGVGPRADFSRVEVIPAIGTCPALAYGARLELAGQITAGVLVILSFPIGASSTSPATAGPGAVTPLYGPTIRSLASDRPLASDVVGAALSG